MSYHTFTLVRQAHIPSLKVTMEEYRHLVTGARHLHLVADDNNNAFLVAFLTVPQDSTGVAHILEHTTLCGSRRYPVRDPFFMMTRRSLNTFMNAFTSSDWTAYPFASQNTKDFDNLLSVYLDAVFFPNLHELDFAQEGCRVEFATPDDPNTDLVYKGVVYNEMKGSMSSPINVLWHTLEKYLYPTITYHHNSGGDPVEIPNLTHEQLKAFHATHYHPSNAVFMTYGNRPAAEYQRLFEEKTLSQFQHLAIDLHIPKEQRYSQPLQITESYAVSENEELKDKTHVVLGWLLGESRDLREVMNCHLLSGILLNNSASPLRHALETTELGTAPSPLCGFSDHHSETTFTCGLEGSNPEHAEAIEQLIFKVLQQVAEQGIPQEQVDAVLHQIELSQREISGDGFPYGLNLLISALSTLLHGGDPLAVLDVDPTLIALRQDCQQADFVPQLIRRLLLDNPHCVRLVMQPDTQLSNQHTQQESNQLAALKANLQPTEVQRIIEQTYLLQQRQQTQDDPEILPKVGLADVAFDILIPEGVTQSVADMPCTWFARGTNGIIYQTIVVNLPEFSDELIDLLPIFCDCVTEVGCGQKDYLATAAWQDAISGGVGARLSVRGDVVDYHQVRGFFTLASKCLVRNQAEVAQLLRETLEHARFDELSRLRELIAQFRAEYEHSITDRGHHLAMQTACSTLNLSGNLSYRWHGIASFKMLKRLDDCLDDDAALRAFSEQLQQIQVRLCAAPRQFFIIGEEEQYNDIVTALNRCWQTSNVQITKPSSPFLTLPMPTTTKVRQIWSTHTQVNFCAKVYPTVPVTHPDAAILPVLGTFLVNGYLHQAIREKGGAYGSGAQYDSDTGAFRFSSYRDPRLADTLADFDRALLWLQETVHQPRALEEAILSVISRIDRPGSPAGEAKTSFFGSLHGRTPQQRRQYRQRILQVTLEDLQRVGRTYFQAEQAHIAVLSSQKVANELAETIGLENNVI